MNRNLTRLVSGLALIAAITLCAPGGAVPVFAAASVDPSTLIPPPPAEFNPVCKGVGVQTICDVAFTESPVVNAPTGIICGSGPSAFELVENSVRSVVGKRFYNADRKLTERHFHADIVGTLTNPLTGAALSFTEHDTVMHLLAVAGDINSGTEATTTSLRWTAPGGRTVLVDAGRFVMADPDGTLLFEKGQHHLDAFFLFGDTTALQPLCDALR